MLLAIAREFILKVSMDDEIRTFQMCGEKIQVALLLKLDVGFVEWDRSVHREIHEL